MKNNNTFNNDLEFIKNFSKISISKICCELNINRQNLLNGRSSNESVLKVKNQIIKEFNCLLEKDRGCFL